MNYPCFLLQGDRTWILRNLTFMDSNLDLLNTFMFGLTKKEKLLKAVADGHLDLIKSLLKENVDINSKGKKLFTPLLVASNSNQPSLINFLLSGGANAYDKTKEGNTSLILCAARGCFEGVKILSQFDGLINIQNNQGVTPLLAAISGGYKSLKNFGILSSDNTPFPHQRKIPQCRKTSGQVFNKMVFELIHKGANVNDCDKYGNSPAILAVEFQNEILLKKLIEHASNINLKNKAGTSPLLLACIKNQDKIVDILINNGADIEIRNQENATPLIEVCEFEYVNIAKKLIDAGCDLDAQDIYGATALMSAAYRNQKEMVKLLIRHSVNPLIKSKNNVTALDAACDVGADCQVICLIEEYMEKYQEN